MKYIGFHIILCQFAAQSENWELGSAFWCILILFYDPLPEIEMWKKRPDLASFHHGYALYLILTNVFFPHLTPRASCHLTSSSAREMTCEEVWPPPVHHCRCSWKVLCVKMGCVVFTLFLLASLNVSWSTFKFMISLKVFCSHFLYQIGKLLCSQWDIAKLIPFIVMIVATDNF